MAIDEKNRSIDLVLATENPVMVFDVIRGEHVPEVLYVPGIELPKNGQVPLLDSHGRETVSKVLGSIRNLRRADSSAGRLLTGRAYFSKAAADTFELYASGHLTDFSIGASRQEIERTKSGGRIVTKSRLLEGSVVVVGADSDAKAVTTATRVYPPRTEESDAVLASMRAEGLMDLMHEPDAQPFVRACVAASEYRTRAEMFDALRTGLKCYQHLGR